MGTQNATFIVGEVGVENMFGLESWVFTTQIQEDQLDSGNSFLTCNLRAGWIKKLPRWVEL